MQNGFYSFWDWFDDRKLSHWYIIDEIRDITYYETFMCHVGSQHAAYEVADMAPHQEHGTL